MKTKVYLIGLWVFFFILIGGVAIVGAAPKASGKTYELTLASYSPTHTPFYTWLKSVWVPNVAKVSGDRLKIKLMFGGVLCSAKEMPEAVKRGLTDMGQLISAYYPTKFPLWTASMLPFLMPEQYDQVYPVLDAMGQHPFITAELDKWNIKFLAAQWTGIYDLMGRKRISNIEDLKGAKVRAIGGSGKILEKFGAVTVSTTAPEMFDAISKGVIDMACHTAGSLEHYGIGEASKYYTELALNACEYFTAINKDSFNNLPEDLRVILLDQMRYYAISGRAISTMQQKLAKKHFKDHGIEFIQFDPKDRAKMEAGSQELWDAWVKDKESKGLPGREFLDFILEARKYYTTDYRTW